MGADATILGFVKHGFALAAGCAVVLAGIVGCSSEDSGSPDASKAPAPTAEQSGQESQATLPSASPAQPDQGRVTLGDNDTGAVTGIGCETKDGLTTISIEGGLHTTVILTDGEAPVVKSVSIGEVGSEGPSLAYVEGVAGGPPVVTRDGKSYTVTGTGMGTDAANPATPVDMPFDIAVTCP